LFDAAVTLGGDGWLDENQILSKGVLFAPQRADI